MKNLIHSILISLSIISAFILWQPGPVNAEETAPGSRYAVVIGVGEYTNESVPPLRYAKADAELFYGFLINEGGFPKDKVKLLTDDQATQVNVRSALGTWLSRNAMKEDTVVIYYAGHGAPEVDPTGESPDGYVKYLVPYDADPKDLFATGVPMKEVETIFKRIESDRVIFLTDTCYSGAAGGRTFSFAPKGRALNVQYDFIDQLTQGEGRAVIASADANEVALEIDKIGHGLFTYYLVKGLKGSADADEDGLVTLDEVYKYAYKNVVKQSRKLGGNQHPVFKGSVTGEIVLASVGGPVAGSLADASSGDTREKGITIPLGGPSKERRRSSSATRYYIAGGMGALGLGSAAMSIVNILKANEASRDARPDEFDRLKRQADEGNRNAGIWLGVSLASFGFGAYTAFADRPFGLSLSKAGLPLAASDLATRHSPRATSWVSGLRLLPFASPSSAGLTLALTLGGSPSFVRRGTGEVEIRATPQRDPHHKQQ